MLAQGKKRNSASKVWTQYIGNCWQEGLGHFQKRRSRKRRLYHIFSLPSDIPKCSAFNNNYFTNEKGLLWLMLSIWRRQRVCEGTTPVRSSKSPFTRMDWLENLQRVFMWGISFQTVYNHLKFWFPKRHNCNRSP